VSLLGRSWGAAGKGGKRAARRTVQTSTDKRRSRSILQPAASGGPGGRLRRPGGALAQGRPSKAAALKRGYTTSARRLATRSIKGLARTRVSPNVLTAAGVTLCAVAAVLVYFEYRNELLFFWLGAVVFVVGSVLDILDGALARQSGKGTPFGAFLDSTTDRMSEGFALGAIALVFAREGNEVALAFSIAAIAGSFLVSYTRARAEALGLKGDVGIGSRAERVVVITAGLVLAPWGLLSWAIYLLAVTAWVTVAQRVLSVRSQLKSS
jgi:CDP-diacylglycerol--glycerol-3-phosphate 3-phosphatidyltransferase